MGTSSRPRPGRGTRPLVQGAAIPPRGHNVRRVRSAYKTRPRSGGTNR
jgi:hypothetical protein